MAGRLPSGDDADGCIESSSSLTDPLAFISENLRIKVLYKDDDIVVIEKPRNLRSVPGFAAVSTVASHNNDQADDDGLDLSSSPSRTSRKRSRSEDPLDESKGEGSHSTTTTTIRGRLTAAEAWRKAILDLAAVNDAAERDEIGAYLAKLGGSESYVSSIPRKFKAFQRYLEKNRNRIFGNNKVCRPTGDGVGCATAISENADAPAPTNDRQPIVVDDIAKQMFQRIQKRQRHLINLPHSTAHTESALGQLILLGYSADANSKKEPTPNFYTVHRLDCATSGVMVFAKSAQAASVLSQAWRDRESVSKVYMARVYDWSLRVDDDGDRHHEVRSNNDDESSLPWGRIDLPLAPSSEPLKWTVCSESDHGAKPSITLWRVVTPSSTGSSNNSNNDESSNSHHVTLQLKPITGRTHQLRVHCAALSGGIVGDSLYGKFAADHGGGGRSYEEQQQLYLHAWKLCFPHPSTQELMEFVSEPKW